VAIVVVKYDISNTHNC